MLVPDPDSMNPDPKHWIPYDAGRCCVSCLEGRRRARTGSWRDPAGDPADCRPLRRGQYGSGPSRAIWTWSRRAGTLRKKARPWYWNNSFITYNKKLSIQRFVGNRLKQWFRRHEVISSKISKVSVTVCTVPNTCYYVSLGQLLFGGATYSMSACKFWGLIFGL